MTDATADPAAPETLPLAVVADATTPDASPEPTPSPEPAPPRPTMVPVSVVTDLRAKARTLEQQLADAQAMVTRLSRQPNPSPDAPPPPAPPPPAPRMDDADIDRRADYKLFVRDVQGMRDQGLKDFGPAFNETIRALEAYGATDDSFIAQVLAVDGANAHKLLDTLAKDPEKAVSLVGMDPTRRIAELTRISMAAAAPKDPAPTPTPPTAPTTPTKPAAAKPAVSRAPAPPPPVEPTAHQEVDWRSDKASEAEFTAGFNDMMKRRSARR